MKCKTFRLKSHWERKNKVVITTGNRYLSFLIFLFFLSSDQTDVRLLKETSKIFKIQLMGKYFNFDPVCCCLNASVRKQQIVVEDAAVEKNNNKT